jgi:hypothetical protein
VRVFAGQDSAPGLFTQLEDAYHGAHGSIAQERLLDYIVGVDWVGDELGFPACIFAHSRVARLVAEVQASVPSPPHRRFGMRIHAGEGVMRPSSSEKTLSAFHGAFKLHMYILMAGIRRSVSELKKAGVKCVSREWSDKNSLHLIMHIISIL